MEDLPKLQDLLDAGHDVEDDDGSGWTLLLHAVDIEIDSHDYRGSRVPVTRPEAASCSSFGLHGLRWPYAEA
jgi:hypothetical protein